MVSLRPHSPFAKAVLSLLLLAAHAAYGRGDSRDRRPRGPRSMAAQHGRAAWPRSMAADTITAAEDHWSAVAGAAFEHSGTTRKHYIQAEQVTWDYVPLGSNLITGEPFGDDENVFVKDFLGSNYTKCLYYGYTDATFTKLVERGPDDAHMGLLGPALYAEVGDRLEVLYRNRCEFRNSVHMHGLFYDKGSEGTPHNDSSPMADMAGDMVAPGGEHTYTFTVPERAGPGPGDGSSSIMWLYHSHTDEIGDTYAGMVGPVVVTAAGAARPDGGPADVEREVFTLWTVMNEGLSSLADVNFAQLTSGGGGTKPESPAEEAAESETLAEEIDEEALEESNLMHVVNGYLYGNMPQIAVSVGERVRWYVFALGTEVDLHTPHWHGNTVLERGRRRDEVELLPATQLVVDMVPDNPGIWLMHCHVNDHLAAGMIDTYTVLP
eukprot:jgi/Ulvmu1/12443/UM009_0095.1